MKNKDVWKFMLIVLVAVSVISCSLQDTFATTRPKITPTPSATPMPTKKPPKQPVLGLVSSAGDFTIDTGDIPLEDNGFVENKVVVIGYSGTLASANSGARGYNPSLYDVVAFLKAIGVNHTTPWQLIATVCDVESGGIRQYNSDGSLVRNDNKPNGIVLSSDWGACQINDVAHPENIGIAKETWQGNIGVGWAYLDWCQNRYKDTAKTDEELMLYTLGCYNGSGKDGEYAKKISAKYDPSYWTPYETPPVTAENLVLMMPATGLRITTRFCELYEVSDLFIKLGIAGKAHCDGVDLAGAGSFDVEAPADVIIENVFNTATSGIIVVMRVKGSLDVTTEYWHLGSVNVEIGQEVAQETIIGTATGAGIYSSGPHLHWRLRIGEVDVNPLDYVK